MTLTKGRVAGLFLLFFLIAFGLGYPILNRYDPGQVPGLTDVKTYAAMVTGEAIPGQEHMRYRVLVPFLAKPFYRLAQGRVRSWDPINFGLLIADSLFVAGTAVLIIILGLSQLGDYATSFAAALLYMVNFCVPNMRLAGLVDAGEGFFLLALFWVLSDRRLWLLPAVLVLGAVTKESFVPLSLVFLVTWWTVARRALAFSVRKLLCLGLGWLASLMVLVAVQSSIRGRFVDPIKFGTSLHQNPEYVRHLAQSLLDRNLWYTFCWLLPIGIPRLKCFPRSWLVPVALTAVMVFVLDSYYGGSAGTSGRALFSVAGPMLALSSASLLVEETRSTT